MKLTDMKFSNQIGLKYILQNLELISPYGFHQIHKLSPYQYEEKGDLLNELKQLNKIVKNYNNYSEIIDEICFQLMKIKDISQILRNLTSDGILDEIELFKIKLFADVSLNITNLTNQFDFKFSNLIIRDLSNIYDLLDPENKKLPTFSIYNAYSEKLLEIRTRKKKIEEELYNTKSNDRIQKLKENRNSIVMKEKKEELRIRKELSYNLLEYIGIMENCVESIGKLDFLIAKAKLAKKRGGCLPKINDKQIVSFEDMNNPLIVDLLHEKGKSFTPISIHLINGVTIISGANMGGKSVCLKSLLLNTLLAQSGFLPFAKSANICLFDHFNLVSDDMQDVRSGLSTFAAEILQINILIEKIKKKNCFILFDEFARGTNPKEGKLILKSLTSYLNRFTSIIIFATHYDEIAQPEMQHYQVNGLKNVNLEILQSKLEIYQQRVDLENNKSLDVIQEYMDYRLEKVSYQSPVPKDALNIAYLLGMEPDIIENIKKEYDKEKQDKLKGDNNE